MQKYMFRMKGIQHRGVALGLSFVLFLTVMTFHSLEVHAAGVVNYMTAAQTSLSVTHVHSESSGTHDGENCWYTYEEPYTETYQQPYTATGTRTVQTTCGGTIVAVASPGITPIGGFGNCTCSACGQPYDLAWNGKSCTRSVSKTQTYTYTAYRTATRTVTRTVYAVSDSAYDTSIPFVSMTLSCQDEDVYDGIAVLRADISEGAYASKWSWSSENKVIWTSEANGAGTIYGSGTELMISAPGTYYCTLLGAANGFTTTDKSLAITVTGQPVNVSKVFVGDVRLRAFNTVTGAYERTMCYGDIVATKIYIGDTLIHDDLLYR